MLKEFISFRTKYSILLWFQQFKKDNFLKKEDIDSKKNQAYIFLAANYGNLGDVAITYAQSKYLNDNTELQTIEIPVSHSLEGLWFVKRNIKKGDLITIVGGGNMGNLYDQLEFIRQLTIRFFPNNQIISFPQTFEFSDDTLGEKALKKAVRVYNTHKSLTLSAREKTSYNKMKKYFPNANVILTPDIVLTLDKKEKQRKRKGVLVCLRNDAEKSLKPEECNYIILNAKKRFGDPIFYDTHISRNNMSIKERVEELNRIWAAFKSVELVITDRLHGMIFSHITGTPTLVFQNNNHKIRETYDWIKDNDNITLMKNFSESTILNFLNNYRYKEGENEVNLTESYATLLNCLKS